MNIIVLQLQVENNITLNGFEMCRHNSDTNVFVDYYVFSTGFALRPTLYTICV